MHIVVNQTGGFLKIQNSLSGFCLIFPLRNGLIQQKQSRYRIDANSCRSNHMTIDFLNGEITSKMSEQAVPTPSCVRMIFHTLRSAYLTNRPTGLQTIENAAHMKLLPTNNNRMELEY